MAVLSGVISLLLTVNFVFIGLNSYSSQKQRIGTPVCEVGDYSCIAVDCGIDYPLYPEMDECVEEITTRHFNNQDLNNWIYSELEYWASELNLIFSLLLATVLSLLTAPLISELIDTEQALNQNTLKKFKKMGILLIILPIIMSLVPIFMNLILSADITKFNNATGITRQDLHGISTFTNNMDLFNLSTPVILLGVMIIALVTAVERSLKYKKEIDLTV